MVSVIMTSTPLSVQVLYWVFFLVAVLAYMLSAEQAILDWLANSAMGYSVIVRRLAVMVRRLVLRISGRSVS